MARIERDRMHNQLQSLKQLVLRLEALTEQQPPEAGPVNEVPWDNADAAADGAEALDTQHCEAGQDDMAQSDAGDQQPECMRICSDGCSDALPNCEISESSLQVRHINFWDVTHPILLLLLMHM